MTAVFVSALRSLKDHAGVIEVDDDTAFFYLRALEDRVHPRIMSCLKLEMCRVGDLDFGVRWNPEGNLVGAVIDARIYGAFRLHEESQATFSKIPGARINEEVRRVLLPY